MICFDVYAWIMFIHVQICVLSDFIMSGNRQLLFCSHNTTDLRRGQQEHLGRQGTSKSRALWSVRDGKGLNMTANIYEILLHIFFSFISSADMLQL